MSTVASATTTLARGSAWGWRLSCVLLGILATGTSLLITVVAGVERGATLPERAAWVATGVVLLLAAHLLPALGRRAPILPRLAGLALWVAAFLAVGYTHTTFFLNAQSGAADLRAEQVKPATSLLVVQKTRSRTVIAADIASATRTVETLKAQSCETRCEALHARRMAAQAHLSALQVEDQEAQRAERMEDGAAQAAATLAQERVQARTDPFVGAVAHLAGLSLPVAGVVIAVCLGWMLDGVAAIAWLYASTPSAPASEVNIPGLQNHDDRAEARQGIPFPVGEPANDGYCVAESVSAPDADLPTIPSWPQTTDKVVPVTLVAEETSEVEILADAIEAGYLRPTNAAIASYMDCGQGRALALRHRLAESRPDLFATARHA